MVSGKRKKFSNEERKIYMAEEAQKRNYCEEENLGKFKKIFLHSEDQMKEYIKYYDYAFEIFNGGQKSLTNVTPVTQYPFYKYYFK